MILIMKRFLDDPELVEEMPPEGRIVIESLLDYVEGRLMPFKQEMDKIEETEDEAGGKIQSFVLIHFPDPDITIHGYTDEMREKMMASFSQSDIDPLWQSILEKLKRFLN